MDVVARRGAGAFQWNAGGWFGAQLGSSCWLVVSGIVMLGMGQLAAGLAPLLAFAACNGLGLWLWSRRAQLDPFVAIQGLIAGMGVATFAAVLAIDRLGQLPALEAGAPDGPRRLYWALLLYPAMMGLFWLQERTARRRRASPRTRAA